MMSHVLLGKRVKVYWNIRKKCFSVQHKGKVVAHLQTVFLKDVVFHVNVSGREKVLRDKAKNVHAYAIGVFTTPEDCASLMDGSNPVWISYNPYRFPWFYVKATQERVDKVSVLSCMPGPMLQARSL